MPYSNGFKFPTLVKSIVVEIREAIYMCRYPMLQTPFPKFASVCLVATSSSDRLKIFITGVFYVFYVFNGVFCIFPLSVSKWYWIILYYIICTWCQWGKGALDSIKWFSFSCLDRIWMPSIPQALYDIYGFSALWLQCNKRKQVTVFP